MKKYTRVHKGRDREYFKLKKPIFPGNLGQENTVSSSRELSLDVRNTILKRSSVVLITYILQGIAICAYTKKTKIGKVRYR